MAWNQRNESLVEKVVGNNNVVSAFLSGPGYRPLLLDGSKAEVPSKSNKPFKKVDLDDVQVFTPLKLAGLTLKNRVIRAAAFDGSNVEEIVATHEGVAKGGVGMTVVAYCCVSKDGRTFPEQLDMTDRAKAKSVLGPVVEACHRQGTAVCAQLTHGGSFSSTYLHGGRNVAPSSVFNPAGFDFPKACDEKDMARLEEDFVRSAEFAVRDLGFDAVELHCGHGYMLSQWMSPLLNCRTDEYGGSAENRARFPLRILKAIRKALGPNVPILVKMNAQDGVKGGLELPDATIMATIFAEDCDLLVISCGLVAHNAFYLLRGTTPAEKLILAMQGVKRISTFFFAPLAIHTIPYDDCFLRDSARAILKAVGDRSKVCILGGVSSLSQMEGAMEEGFAAVQMARPLIREPDFLLRIQREIQQERTALKEGRTAKAEGDDKVESAEGFDVETKCIRCNQCVIASVDPAKDLGCPFRRLEEASAKANASAPYPPGGAVGKSLSISPTMARSIVKDIEDMGRPKM